MDQQTSFTHPTLGDMWASPSGMVGIITPGWLMVLPPIGETIRSFYTIPATTIALDVAIQRTGAATYKLSMDGGAPTEHRYDPRFLIDAPFFTTAGEGTNSATVPFTESPGPVYFQPGPSAGGMSLSIVAAAAAAFFLLR